MNTFRQTLKQTSAFALSALLSLAGLAVFLPQSAYALAGDGSEEDPWQITNCTELQSLNTDAAHTAAHSYVLTQDINCTGVTFNEIEFGSDDPFSGTFDGADYTISNVTVSGGGNVIGFFSHIEGGTVRNLTLDTIVVDGEQRAGVLAGIADQGALIENVRVTNGTVTSDDEGEQIGGLVGVVEDSEFYDVIVDITVSAPDAGSVGGMVGETSGSTFGRVAALGNVEGDNLVGGLVGTADDSAFDKAFATGDIVSHSGDAGGLAGATSDTEFIGTYARGDVSGPTNIGGHTGYAGEGTYIGWAYATGDINLTGMGASGGLIGDADNDADIDANTFWDVQTTGMMTSAGEGEVGKTTAEMKDMETYLPFGWDFEDYWFQDASVNDGYLCQIWYQVCYDAFIGGGSENNKVTFSNDVAGATTTVELGDDCSITGASGVAEGSVKDAGYHYKTGLVSFSATCSGDSTTVKIYQYGAKADGLVLRKHNPTTNAYFTIAGATITTETIDNQSVVVATYEIEDNGPLDLDNRLGYITDPVGLANLGTGTPNTGAQTIHDLLFVNAKGF